MYILLAAHSTHVHPRDDQVLAFVCMCVGVYTLYALHMSVTWHTSQVHWGLVVKLGYTISVHAHTHNNVMTASITSVTITSCLYCTNINISNTVGA